MTFNKTVWTALSLDSIGIITESDLSSCTAINLSSTVQLSVTVCNSYNESNVSAARLRLYASHNNATWDTDPYAYYDNEFDLNTSKRITVPVSPDPAYLKATVENQNLTGNISSIEVIVTQGYIS